jgi:hypothetical protein
MLVTYRVQVDIPASRLKCMRYVDDRYLHRNSIPALPIKSAQDIRHKIMRIQIIKIRYRCSHRCSHPFFSPQEESQATKQKFSSPENKAIKEEESYLKRIPFAILHNDITPTYPIDRTHTYKITEFAKGTFILSKRTRTIFWRPNTRHCIWT